MGYAAPPCLSKATELAENELRAGQVNEGKVALGLPLPSHEQPKRVVQPTVCPLHHPASCSTSLPVIPPLPATARDVDLVASPHDLTRLVSSPYPKFRLRSCRAVPLGSGRRITTPSRVAANSFRSCRLALATAAASGTLLAAIAGVGPARGAAEGALVVIPSTACRSRSMPRRSSCSSRPSSHRHSNRLPATHDWKRRWAGLLHRSLGRAFHWHSVRRTERMALRTRRSSTRRRPPRRLGGSGWIGGSIRAQVASSTSQGRVRMGGLQRGQAAKPG